jgi:COMPASS component SWD3
LKTLVHEDNAPVTSVKFSPNGRYVLAATLDNSLRLWNYVEGRCVKTYQGHKNEKFSIGVCFGTYSVSASAREELEEEERQKQWAFAACGSEDGSTVLWDVNSKEVLQRLQGHEGVVLGVDVCVQDGAVATCGKDKTIKIYRRRTNAANGNEQTEGGPEHVEQQNDSPPTIANGNGSAPPGQSPQPTRDTTMKEG